MGVVSVVSVCVTVCLQEGPFFKHITGMYSELLAVGTNGKLHGWMWLSPIPSTRPHPLEANLEIADESVRLLSGKLLRGSVITESGKVRTGPILWLVTPSHPHTLTVGDVCGQVCAWVWFTTGAQGTAGG